MCNTIKYAHVFTDIMARPRKKPGEIRNQRINIAFNEAEFNLFMDIYDELQTRAGKFISIREMVLNAVIQTYDTTTGSTDAFTRLDKTFEFTETYINKAIDTLKDILNRNAQVKMAVDRSRGLSVRSEDPEEDQEEE